MKLLQVIELEEGKCNKCKKNYDSVLVGSAIDKNTIYLCDTCLQNLNRDIVEYLASKYI